MTMGEIIKKQRQQVGMTQEELAEKLGLKKSAIAKYESGRVQNIKRSTLEKMAAIFNCTPSSLMGFQDQDLGFFIRDTQIGSNDIFIEQTKINSTNSLARYMRYVEMYMQLDSDNQERLNKYAETLLSLQEQEQSLKNDTK